MPAQAWHGAVATAGFALVFVKFRMWATIAVIGDLNVGGKLLIGATNLGILVAFIALATREA